MRSALGPCKFPTAATLRRTPINSLDHPTVGRSKSRILPSFLLLSVWSAIDRSTRRDGNPERWLCLVPYGYRPPAAAYGHAQARTSAAYRIGTAHWADHIAVIGCK